VSGGGDNGRRERSERAELGGILAFDRRRALLTGLAALVLGGGALALLLLAFRAACGETPPAPGEAVVLRDPSSSTRFDPGRVPRPLRLAALAGAGGLAALAAIGLVRTLGRGH
jgi:hypothetical protein